MCRPLSTRYALLLQARLLRLSLPCSNPRPGMKLPAVTAKRLPILVRSYLQGDQQQDAEPE